MHVSITHVRRSLAWLSRELRDEVVAITRRGEPVLALMSWDMYESLLETAEILGDKDLMGDIRAAMRDMREGKRVAWKKAKKGLMM